MLCAVADATTDPIALIARVAHGDSTAFTVLVGQLYGPNLRIATRMLGSRADAEDALQQALTKLWTQAGRFEPGRGSVEGWFRRILVNVCLDRLRAFRIVQPLEAAAEVASPDPSPFEAAVDAALGRRIDAAMMRLNPRQRAAVMLFHGEGASMAEVALALGTTAKAVEGLLARARTELSMLLRSERVEM